MNRPAQVNLIRGLTKAQYFQLRELCFFSNCLYNFALYNVRQKFFKDKTYLHFESNYHECKDNDNYKLLQSNMAQQTLRAVDFAFKSFFGSLGKVKGARPPHYRKKGGLYNLIITGNSISIQNGYSTVPQSRTYSSVLNNHRIRIKVPERLQGKKINQQFTQIPFGALRRQLENLCSRYGMSYIEQEESYTSKASFLDLDEIPIYDAETPYTGTFSGKRIKRGLYRSKSGRLINADVNGAANILRKSKQKVNFERLCTGFLDNPLRIRVA